MPSQKMQINKITGKAQIRAATGKAVFAFDGTPCGCALCGGGCDGHGRPDTVKIVLAGWSATNACVTTQAGDSFDYKYNTFNINGAFCLPVCPPGDDLCRWGDTFDGLISINSYQYGLGCASTLLGTAARLFIRVEKNTVGDWNFKMSSARVYPDCGGSTYGPCGFGPDFICDNNGENEAFQVNADLLSHFNCMDTVFLTDISTFSIRPNLTIGTIQLIPNGCGARPGFRAPNVGGQLVYNGI